MGSLDTDQINDPATRRSVQLAHVDEVPAGGVHGVSHLSVPPALIIGSTPSRR
jgi:hypothetical protein